MISQFFVKATHSRAIEDVEMKNEEDTELEDSDIVLSDDDQENHNILSSYEIERLENIKKNEMFFKELKMDEVDFKPLIYIFYVI